MVCEGFRFKKNIIITLELPFPVNKENLINAELGWIKTSKENMAKGIKTEFDKDLNPDSLTRFKRIFKRK